MARNFSLAPFVLFCVGDPLLRHRRVAGIGVFFSFLWCLFLCFMHFILLVNFYKANVFLLLYLERL